MKIENTLLDFNFSVVRKEFSKVQESFNDYCSLRIDKFAEDYRKILPKGVAEKVLAARDCHRKLRRGDRLHEARSGRGRAWKYELYRDVLPNRKNFIRFGM